MGQNKNTKKMVLCESCGAEFDATLVRCPYCGTGYAPAEEEEYMESLEGIRTDLDAHAEVADDSIKKGIGATVLVGLLVFIVLLSLLIGGVSISLKLQRNKVENQKQEFLQKQGIETE
ncbi:MAG: hypothetical protein E7271_12710 [Lachnospiraceae bacterium]|nr:hypothetical protein [Lachnospiraceae bacterium]